MCVKCPETGVTSTLSTLWLAGRQAGYFFVLFLFPVRILSAIKIPFAIYLDCPVAFAFKSCSRGTSMWHTLCVYHKSWQRALPILVVLSSPLAVVSRRVAFARNFLLNEMYIKLNEIKFLTCSLPARSAREAQQRSSGSRAP